MVFIFTVHFIYSFAHSQTFMECQVWAWHCTTQHSAFEGCQNDTPECLLYPLTVHPMCFLISRKIIAYSLAKYKREHLAQLTRW